jgi:hypothetical protein
MAGAPKGNKNREITEEQRKRGANTNLSMDYETWEAFKAAADLYEGGTLSDDEYKVLWRELCRGAVAAFIKQHNGLIDPAAIII